jgi:hypothetical protein
MNSVPLPPAIPLPPPIQLPAPMLELPRVELPSFTPPVLPVQNDTGVPTAAEEEEKPAAPAQPAKAPPMPAVIVPAIEIPPPEPPSQESAVEAVPTDLPQPAAETTSITIPGTNVLRCQCLPLRSCRRLLLLQSSALALRSSAQASSSNW